MEKNKELAERDFGAEMEILKLENLEANKLLTTNT